MPVRPQVSGLCQCVYPTIDRRDDRKHLNKHRKPFKCVISDCSRVGEGFSTLNDLERHKKSIHNIQPTHGSIRSFKCASDGCKGKTKVWPRRDNFKQHVTRVHKNEDLEEILKLYVCPPAECFLAYRVFQIRDHYKHAGTAGIADSLNASGA